MKLNVIGLVRPDAAEADEKSFSLMDKMSGVCQENRGSAGTFNDTFRGRRARHMKRLI